MEEEEAAAEVEEKREIIGIHEQHITHCVQCLFISLINQGQMMLLNILFATSMNSMIYMHTKCTRCVCISHFVSFGFSKMGKSKNNC